MSEEQYLSLVLNQLNDKIIKTDQKLENNARDMESMHDYFWENYTEFDEYGYEMYDNRQALKTRLTQQEEEKKERIKYQKMLDSPYFGRVDFCYEGEEESEVYYIGIGNLAKDRADIPLVFDWRAPVSGLFYDYDKGPGQFEAPAGLLKGEITRKKQYKIRQGKIIYILENEMNIDDEILQQALSEQADAKLKSIVTTIQKEQNSIVRDTKHRILAVQGCAGSGKTSVALHRIAYLLYHNRKNLKASQILILSPNSIFGDYISRILPELGENNICEMTLDDYAYKELKEYGEAEDRYDEMEKLLHDKEDEIYFITHELKKQTEEAAYKQTREYVEELDEFILQLEWNVMNFKDFSYKRMYHKESELVKLFYEKFCDVPILSRMQKIGEFFIDAEETLRDKDMEEEEKVLIFQRLDRMYETKSPLRLYNQFLEETGREPLDVSDRRIRYEDVYPLLYLKYAVMEAPKRRIVKHLVIDEMQDYSYLQYRIVQKLFDCPMTILGDKVQTMADEHQNVLSFLPRIFGKGIHSVELNKSYRSTTEITAFANSLIQETGNESVLRHGEAPKVQECADEAAMVTLMAKQIEEQSDRSTIAVLCLDAEKASRISQKLRQQMGEKEINLLTKDSMKFQKGISVMPFYLAKGLEFDAVFVPDVQTYVTPLHRQALYINATRALHVLKLYRTDSGKASR